ncbi:SGNH/GDSL hydrolase family protein [Geomesophilobacter sediminis]|uniref:Uncharacterized protein n=1 Tax=Geomesophilobacter sediminis TaxID=2798584 RepID=A0A8J7IKM6_9BACT|nr:SGNH/GDSL hydrolase family protein [Geomesophilobacter sediminis]MBJ6723168.1 hypothetical protein [Geomesophilobacter sediminis]
MKSILSKIAVHLFLLLVTLVVIERYARYIDTFSLNNYEQAYGKLFKGPKVKNIIIGSSHAAQGINPKYLSPEFYNFALDGAGSTFFLKWYENFFLKYQGPPSIVVYEVDWFMFLPKHLTRRIEDDSRYYPNAVLAALLSRGEADRVSLLRNKYLILNSGILFRKVIRLRNMEADQNTRCNGFVAFAHDGSLKPIDPQAFTGFDDSKVRAFKSLIRKMQSGNTRVILVQAPEYVPSWGPVAAPRHNKLLEEIAAQCRVPFLNYNGGLISGINFDRSMFADPGHLNRDGSTRYSKQLNKDMAAVLERYPTASGQDGSANNADRGISTDQKRKR